MGNFFFFLGGGVLDVVEIANYRLPACFLIYYFNNVSVCW